MRFGETFARTFPEGLEQFFYSPCASGFEFACLERVKLLALVGADGLLAPQPVKARSDKTFVTGLDQFLVLATPH